MVHEARVLHARVKTTRDVHRVYTYEIDAQCVETGSKQPIYSREGPERVLRLARTHHKLIFDSHVWLVASALRKPRKHFPMHDARALELAS